MANEIVQLLSGTIDFSRFLRDATIPIIDSSQTLRDINLSFYVTPSVISPYPAQWLHGAADIRLYISRYDSSNDTVRPYDVTAGLIAELQAAIRRLPLTTVRAQYMAGVDAYFRYVRNLHIVDNEIAEDPQRAAEIAAVGDWGTHFKAPLGDQSYGWAGNLHPVCFIYRYISIQPVSLQSVWEIVRPTYAQQEPNLPNTLADLPLGSITLSQGPSPVAGDYDQYHPHPAGRMVYRMELLLENPLSPLLKQVLQKLLQLGTGTENLRVNYLEPTLNTVNQTEADLTRMETSINQRLQQLTDTVTHIG